MLSVQSNKMEEILTHITHYIKPMLLAFWAVVFAFCDNCFADVFVLRISDSFTKDFDVISLYVSRGLSIICSLCGIYLFWIRKNKLKK